jgi:hypothetical protein
VLLTEARVRAGQPCRASVLKSRGGARAKAGVRGLGVDPGHETELLRRLWWAVARQDGRSMVEQEARCSGAEWGSGARVWGGCKVGDEGTERSRGGLKRNAGDLGRGRARGKAGDLGPDVARPVHGEEEGEERGSADVRARSISG